MHELGIMINVVSTVENFARQNGVSKIDTLVLQVGELSPVVPQYIQACYPAAVARWLTWLITSSCMM